MFGRKATKGYRGKCPTCGTQIRSKTSSFKCPNCRTELQLKGRQEFERRAARFLWAIPVAVIALLGIAFLGLLINPRFMARYLPGYTSYLESMDVGFSSEATGAFSGTDSVGSSDPLAVDESARHGSIEAEEIYKRVNRSIITVEIFGDGEKSIGQGTGFFVDCVDPPGGVPVADGPVADGPVADGPVTQGPSSHARAVSGTNCDYLVTNYHIVVNAHRLRIVKERKVIGRVLRVLIEDHEADLALLEVELKPGVVAPTLQLAVEDLNVGENAYAIGNPSGLEASISDGILSGIRRNGSSGSVLQLTCKAYFGSSGGPILNAKGRVVGVTFGGLADYLLAASRQSVRDLLHSRMKPRLPAQGRSMESEVKQLVYSLESDSRLRGKESSPLHAVLNASKQMDQPLEAIKILDPVVDQVPDDWRFFACYFAGKARSVQLAYHPDGTSLAKKDMYVAAQQFLERSIVLRPEFNPAKALACQLMLRAKQYEKALVLARELTKESPYYRDAWLMRSECHLAFSMIEQAMRDLGVALKSDPFSRVGEQSLVKFLSSRSRYQHALAYFNSKLSRNDQKEYAWHYLLGVTHEAMQEHQKAIDSFHESIADGGPWKGDIEARIQILSFKIEKRPVTD